MEDRKDFEERDRQRLQAAQKESVSFYDAGHKHERTSVGVAKQGIHDSGNRTGFGTGAVRDRPQGKGRFVLLSPIALRRIALRAEDGERKYGDGRNWEKGMPVSEFLDSALRHLAQYMAGDDNEDHLAAAAWNLQAAMQTEELHPDMQNIPGREGKVYVWYSQFAEGWNK